MLATLRQIPEGTVTSFKSFAERVRELLAPAKRAPGSEDPFGATLLSSVGVIPTRTWAAAGSSDLGQGVLIKGPEGSVSMRYQEGADAYELRICAAERAGELTLARPGEARVAGRELCITLSRKQLEALEPEQWRLTGA